MRARSGSQQERRIRGTLALTMDVPQTRYVRVQDADVAYQVIGDGSVDLVYCRTLQHVDVSWEHPASADYLRALASFSRLILLDRRGFGASDALPHGQTPTWEGWAEDIHAVLDAVGSQQAALFGESDAGAICVLFTAMHPKRVRALILGNTSARLNVSDDYPIGYPPEVANSLAEMVEKYWGSIDLVRMGIPSRSDDAGFLAWAAKVTRAAATPRSAGVQYRYMIESQDVRAALPLIQVPTLVLHHTGHPWIPIEHGRFLAGHIAGARFVEIPSQDAPMGVPYERVVEEIAQFLTGQRPVSDVDRVLTTILFTDIVESTERAAAAGDQRWRGMLDAHDGAVREQLARFRGREINTTGDGFMASFDGPARAIRCAQAIAESVRELGIEIRAGIHTGECEVRGDDLAGLAVHIAARLGALAQPNQVLVSSTVKELVAGSELKFEDRGEHELKGVPDTWRVFAVTS